ncbi:MAG: DUF447 family protein [Thiotrichales bacterium]|nr:DUF447 family protein [Thiotrichales bacterium]
MIREVIVTTVNADGSVHIAPMGIRTIDRHIVIAPFRPSTTLENLQREKHATVNRTDDVTVFAGCLTGRYDWPVTDTKKYQGFRLTEALSHIELEVSRVEEDELRPRFFCNILIEENHAPFQGLNRAQAAVLEAAILVSRLHMLPADKINREIEYLQIAIDKTASDREITAWGWLMDKIVQHQTRQKGTGTA